MKQTTSPAVTWTVVALAIAAASWLGGSAIAAPDTAEFGGQAMAPTLAMLVVPN